MAISVSTVSLLMAIPVPTFSLQVHILSDLADVSKGDPEALGEPCVIREVSGSIWSRGG